MLFEEGGQGALGEPLGGGQGDLLEGEEIDVGSRSGVAEGASGDDFAPLGRQFAEVLEFLGCELRRVHPSSCLGVTSRAEGGFPRPFYDRVLWLAKPVLASATGERLYCRWKNGV